MCRRRRHVALDFGFYFGAAATNTSFEVLQHDVQLGNAHHPVLEVEGGDQHVLKTVARQAPVEGVQGHQKVRSD